MARRGDTVLILTHAADRFVVERVASEVTLRGARAVRFDTDAFPSAARLAARLEDDLESHVLTCGGTALEARDVCAVWARRLWRPELPSALAPEIAAGCRREIGAALRGWLGGLEGARWINPLAATAAAEDKLAQLRAARALGLAVPRTLVTNDPAAVRAFRADVGPLVTKMLTPLSTGLERAPLFVHTSLVGDDDLEALEGLSLCPMVFQELVPKAIELRVACVGRRAFAGAIDASRSAAGQVDWRKARPDEVRWEQRELPARALAALGELLETFGLAYGAVDLIETPAGELVFLEVNPSGEWGMLERDLGLPIAAALADELLRTVEQRA